MRSTQQDLTTKARIRDAAIVVFGEQGFTAGVRAIATAAGVSPGLVIHHFGSKDGLREVCDDFVLDEIRRAKTDFLQTPSVDRMFTELAAVEKYAPLVGYLVRSFQASGRVAAQLFDHMVADTAAYLEAGVAAGTVKPSRDPQARARMSALWGLGAMLLYLQIHEGEDFATVLGRYTAEVSFPALELYTQGILTDSSLFDGLVAARDNNSDKESA